VSSSEDWWIIERAITTAKSYTISTIADELFKTAIDPYSDN